MKNFVEYVVKNLVEFPDDVNVTSIDEGNCLVLKVSVNPEDMGKVIGKQGKMAKAIRSIMKAIATREHKKVNVEFLD